MGFFTSLEVRRIHDNIDYLTSKKRYDALDIQFIDQGNHEECYSLERELENDNDAYVLCMKVTGNLNNFNNIKFFDSLNDYRCKYLNFWTHETLNKYKGKHTGTLKSRVLNFFKNFNGKDSKCHSEFIDYVITDDYKKMKSFYDYALNYQMLQFDHEKSEKPCTKRIDNYIRTIIKLYNQVKQECTRTDTSSKKYCIALEDIKQVYPQGELWKLTCNEVVTEKTAKILEEISTLREENTRLQAPITQICEQERVAENGEKSASFCHDCPPCSSGSNRCITVAVPLLVILFIFIILSKFTPLGSSLSRYIIKKKGAKMNINEEEIEESLEHTFNYVDKNSEMSGNVIGYNPTENGYY
ncbi:PIR Superfamily Protein [Plasmodium ovale wallikeri]|uniref:PIR Superfamily Protein n=1 Tax=Plasmodium ovale wallikeri TaxID=864142 RepID=A0A1A9AJA2_PLAOA|nr:PIR Superfamily Protein [Plasmodium ovale wallikeri]